MIYRSKEVIEDINVPNDPAYLAEVRDILANKEVQSMSGFIQHGSTTCLEHSINVSYLTYLYCKEHGMDARAAARAGLLHDLFLYDWHQHYVRRKGEALHGFSHPRRALENAQKAFSLTAKEKNMILRHMWPLTVIPPKYKEGFVLLWYDKYCSMNETMRRTVLAFHEAPSRA